MPRVPVVVENDVALRPVARERYDAVDQTAVGREIGRGLEQLGQAGSQYAEQQDRLDTALDNAAAKTIDNEFVTGAQAIRANFLTTQGLNAGSQRGATEQSLRDLASSSLGKATTPRMRRLATDVINQRVAGMMGEFATHVTTQTFKADDDASLARIGLAGDEAASATDPVLRQQNVDTGLGEIRARGAKMGWGADATKAEERKFTSGVHRSILEGMLTADDIDSAVSYLDAHRDGMTAGDEQRIDAMLRDPLQRRETNSYVDKVMGTATGGDTSASFSYSDPLHGAGRTPVPGGRFNAARDYGGHQGADIPAPLGSAVFSASPGIARVSSSKLGGTTVTVDDGAGNVTRYMHLGRVSIKDGDRVTPDTQIGAVGMTGRTSGPHLHFEVMQNGRHVDPERTVGTVQQSPQRHDLAALLARVDRDPSLTPEQRDRYKGEIERRVGRDEQLLRRSEDDAQRRALDVIGNLGPDGFTNMTQLPAGVRAGLSSQDRLTFMNMADANVKAAAARARGAEEDARAKANGPDAYNLNMMAIYQPEQFKALNLGMYQARVTPSELEGLGKLQANMRVAGPQAVDHSKVFGIINRNAPFLGIDISAPTKGKEPSKAQLDGRAKTLRIADMMRADLNARTGGTRQPTDDEVQASFDRATRQVVVGGDTDNPMRAYEVDSVAGNVPDVARQQIVSAFRRQNGRQPTEREIATYYARRPR